MKIRIDELRETIANTLRKLGLTHEEIDIITDYYCEVEAYDVKTHGINVLPTHLDKIIERVYNINSNIEIIKEEKSYTTTNGNNLIGILSGYYNMKLAIEKAKKSGIHTVFSNNNNTLGAAFYYNNMALKEKMIGITFCNSPAQMAPINGKEKLIGTNPIAISIPAKNEKPIIFDIATSAVAKSKIKQAFLENKQIPLGWATNINGEDTTNPEEAINGLILPMAGYKGYGLSIIIDILSGLISGAAYLNNVGKFYGNSECMNLGFSFIAIDPKQICGETFYDNVDNYIKTIKESEKNETITLPGEDRILKKINAMKSGIEVDENIINDIKLKGEENG